MTIERDPFLTIVAMNAAAARAMIGGPVVKVEYQGQADPTRYRFGAKVYRVYPVRVRVSSG